jgi:serine/threonine protein kinase
VANFDIAFLEGSPPALIVTPAALRAPEVILKGQLTRALDIWSFGCLVFEIITGHQLFHAEALDGDRFDETTNDEHLIQITETIQPLPEALFKEWRRVDSYYGPDGGLIGTHSHDDSRDSDGGLDRGSTEGLGLSLAEGFGKSLAGDSSQASSRGSGRDSPGGSGRDLSGGGLGKGSTGERRDIQTDWSDDDVDDSSEEAPLAFPQRCETLEKRFRAVKPDDINEQEEGEIVQLMRMVLQPDATKRASAADLLQQSWFRE